MQTEALRNSTLEILDYLETVPYSAATVRYYGFCYENLILYCSGDECLQYDHQTAKAFSDFQLSRSEEGEISKIYALTMRKAAYVLADYLLTGIIDWKHRSYSERVLCRRFDAILTEFRMSIMPSLADGSLKLVTDAVRHFLFYLEECGCGLEDLDMAVIMDYIIREAPKHTGNRVNFTWPLKKFMHYLRLAGLVGFDADPLFKNPAQNRCKVLPCFEPEELESIFGAVDTDSAIGKRDMAIMKLSLSTGLRCCDLLDLKLGDIDWRRNEIHVTQNKTDTELVLPIMPDAGNALADYILHARPHTDNPFVFLRTRRPFVKLEAHTNGANIIGRYQKAAGIMRTAGDGKTFHAFRRTAGTNMVCSDVPLTTVSQMLGHTRLDSTRRYLSLHDEMLAECCMDMGGLLTTKEGLA